MISPTSGLNHSWTRLSLAQQFALASLVILTIGMLSTAAWVSNRIQNGVVSNSALSAALFMDSFIAPLLQDMSTTNQMPESNQVVLNQLIENTPLGEQVLSYKIWGRGGVIVHSSNQALIGRTFPVTDTLQGAWNGTIQTEYDNLEDLEDTGERALRIPLLEIYSPIRNKSGNIIAVSEFYANAEQLEKELFTTSLQSWMLFGGAGVIMFVALSSIALRGSRTIDSQQAALKNRVAELSVLRERLQKASRRSTELNESFLRRVGADLHDGPAQLIALALLKLEQLSEDSRSPADRQALGTRLKEPLQDALTEIRNLSSGLILPGFEGLSTQKLLEKAANSHSRRTGVEVVLDIQPELSGLCVPDSIMICIYRFVQETLNNSFHHGQVSQVTLTGRKEQNLLSITVADNGQGFDSITIERNSAGLGLPGLRERIESVGGTFNIQSKPGNGTVVCASFNTDNDQ